MDAFLKTLSAEKRAIFALAFLEEMPAPEIAQALSVPLNTVYSRMRAVRVELRTALERQKTPWRWPMTKKRRIRPASADRPSSDRVRW